MGHFLQLLCMLSHSSHVLLFAALRTVAFRVPLSMGFSCLAYWSTAAAAAKSLQSCLTLCDPIDGSPPGPPVPGIFQARTLEWVAIAFSSAGKWKVKVKLLSCVWLLATPWTAAYQAPPSMGFSRQEYWSGVPLPSPTGVLVSINVSDAFIPLAQRYFHWEVLK